MATVLEILKAIGIGFGICAVLAVAGVVVLSRWVPPIRPGDWRG